MVQQAVHILLALMVLLSTTGITISKHFCKTQLRGIAVFVEAQNCHEAKSACCVSDLPSTKLSCCSSSKQGTQLCNTDGSNNCCHNEINYVKNKELLLIQSDIQESIDFEEVVVAILSNIHHFLLEPNSSLSHHHSNAPPLSLHRNTRILMQSFLC